MKCVSHLGACLKLIVAWIRERGLIFRFSVLLVVMERFHCGIWKWKGVGVGVRVGEWGSNLV